MSRQKVCPIGFALYTFSPPRSAFVGRVGRPPCTPRKPRPMAAALDESSTTTYAANYSSSSDAEPASTSPTSTIPESRGRSKIVSLEKSAAGPLQQSD